MQTLYQIINIRKPFGWTKSRLFSQYHIKVIKEEDVISELPKLYLYWLDSEEASVYDGEMNLENLAYDGEILPIIEDAANFVKFAPKQLTSINAMVLNGEIESEALNNYILEYFGIIHSTRKVFISYKRSDTSFFANQLFDAFTKAKYKPFLDCYSIESGVPFQENLRDELTDADLFIYVNSPNYQDSQYTEEEKECALKLNVGIVQIVFKDTVVDNSLFNASVVEIPEIAQGNKEYDSKWINNIMLECERKRAEMYAFRRKALIHSLKVSYAGIDMKEYNLHVLYDDNSRQVFYVTVTIPTSNVLQYAESVMTDDIFVGYNKSVVYDAQYCKRETNSHLAWLNTYLPIKSEDINK